MAGPTEAQLKEAARKALAAGNSASAKRLIAAARKAGAAAQVVQPGQVPRDAAGQPTGPQAPPRADAPPSPPVAATGPQGFGETAFGLLAALGDGTRQGAAMVAGAPVDLVNSSPMLLNLLPGEQGFGPFSDSPIGGRATMDAILRQVSGIATDIVTPGPSAPAGTEPGLFGLPAVRDFEPRTGAERILNRVGEEVGATAIPVGGALAKASTMPVATVNRMASAPASVGEGIAAQFLQPAAVNPVGLATREALYAGGAGLGAGLANEAAGDNAGMLSDLLGSVLGAGAMGTLGALGGGAMNLAAGATGSPKFADDVASAAVAERLMNSSTGLQTQGARLKDAGVPPTNLSTDDLVRALRTPAAVEDAVPGYRANIADRTADPGLATLSYNTDAVSPGAASARRVGNEAAVNERMAGMAPDGDPARFRTDLQTGVDTKIGAANAAQKTVEELFDDIVTALQPTMRDASARGSSIRSALADAYSGVQDRVQGMYEPINQSDAPVDIGPLREAFSGIDQSLPLNDRTRFRPGEADVAQQLEGTVPLREVTSMRSGLTDDVRAQRAAGQNQAARVGDQYVGAVDRFTDDAIPPELKAALDDARSARRDQGERFERPGTALESILAKREGGGYALDDSAVPGKIAQPDQGRVSDLGAAWREAGTDPRLREGLADEVRSQVVERGLLNKPQALAKFLSEREILLADFPELRMQLEKAGTTRAELTAIDKAATETTKRLTTPGRSAEASYLKNVEDPAAAIRSVTSSAGPRKAVADLVATANSPQARTDLRAALWEEVKRTGKLQADGMTGETRWNGKKLRAMFDDPKFSAVAEELWKDDPEDLANIRTVFDALAGAEGSTRARAPNTSGTAQALSGKLDPALTASSLASRARSVTRGQLSPTIAVVDVLGTWLRRRSAQVQSRAIDQITAAVVNNPGLAADLLERYNPATAAARRKMLTQKYGVRVTSLLNVLDEAENEDPVLDAVGEK